MGGNWGKIFQKKSNMVKGAFYWKQEKFIYKYTIFIIFTFKMSQESISWASRKTKMPNCIFFLVLTMAEAALEVLLLLIYLWFHKYYYYHYNFGCRYMSPLYFTIVVLIILIGTFVEEIHVWLIHTCICLCRKTEIHDGHVI